MGCPDCGSELYADKVQKPMTFIRAHREKRRGLYPEVQLVTARVVACSGCEFVKEVRPSEIRAARAAV